jgi:hypothetical protein
VALAARLSQVQFWTALDKLKAGEYGATDEREMFDDGP